MIAEYAGLKYDLLEYEQADNLDKSCWTDVKYTLGMPFPNLPYLVDGDFKISETSAIINYICNISKPELLGVGARQMATVEMTFRILRELKIAVAFQMYNGDVESN